MKASTFLIASLFLISIVMIFDSGSYYSSELSKDVFLHTSSDTDALVQIAENPGNEFLSMVNGSYRLAMQVGGSGSTYDDVFYLINNSSFIMQVSVTDHGAFDSLVSFSSGTIDLESSSISLLPGASAGIDISIGGGGIPFFTSLIDGFDIECAYGPSNSAKLSRLASIEAIASDSVILQGHDGQGLSGGVARYYASSEWHDIYGHTDSNGNLYFSIDDYEYIRVYYNGTYYDKTQSQIEDSNIWQTGRFINDGFGPRPEYIYINGWVRFEYQIEVFPGSYLIRLVNGREYMYSVNAGQTTYI